MERILQSGAVDVIFTLMISAIVRNKKANLSNLGAFLYRAVRHMIKSKNTFQLESGFIWDYIRNVLHGADIRLDKYLYNAAEKQKLKTKN
jgi:hypothetical protein